MARPPRRATPQITQSAHRPRHQSGVRGLLGPGTLCVLGALVFVAGLIDTKASGIVANVIGIVLLLLGVWLLVGRLPGIGRWSSSRAEVRAGAEGIVLEGDRVDTTVRWSDFRGLRSQWDGSVLRVWIDLVDGRRLAVPTLSRRGLLTERARARAQAEVERVDATLRTAQAEQSAAGSEQTGDPT